MSHRRRRRAGNRSSVSAFIGLFLLLFLSGRAWSQGEARVAVLGGAGSSAPKNALAFLEVALTKVPEFTLLERAQVSKVLAEQKLSAAGLLDPAAAVKLGQLLKVDLFLVMDAVQPPKLPGAKENAPLPPRQCIWRAIDARSGVVLATGSQAESAVGKDAAPVLTTLRQAQEKRRIPSENRRYVAVIEFHSEEAGQKLDALAKAMGAFLLADLASAPTSSCWTGRTSAISRGKRLLAAWRRN